MRSLKQERQLPLWTYRLSLFYQSSPVTPCCFTPAPTQVTVTPMNTLGTVGTLNHSKRSEPTCPEHQHYYKSLLTVLLEL